MPPSGGRQHEPGCGCRRCAGQPPAQARLPPPARTQASSSDLRAMSAEPSRSTGSRSALTSE